MKLSAWYSGMTRKQKGVFFFTLIFSVMIVSLGLLFGDDPSKKEGVSIDVTMSIKQIAPQLGVTGKSLARELGLPLDVSKSGKLADMGVEKDELDHVAEHLLSHEDTNVKYYFFVSIVFLALVYLSYLGVSWKNDPKNKKGGYPRLFYYVVLCFSLVLGGFYWGKSPNPMEGIVKVFKSMVGLYPDPWNKVLAFVFFAFLAVIGNKLICGWACPFGALQELIFSLPFFKKIKKKKSSYVVTNTIRSSLFIITLLFLFGIVGGKKGFVLYHYINPFNLFNFDFEETIVVVSLVVVIFVSFFFYRPFCQLICPFGLFSRLLESASLWRVKIDKTKCVECGACVDACPCQAAEGMVYEKKFRGDCFSCGRCLDRCPEDAIKYEFVFSNNKPDVREK